MSFTIDQALISSFRSDVYMQAQQKGSKLRGAVRVESQAAESDFYERLAKTQAQKKISRHGDTPLVSSIHSRRRCTLEDFEWADLIDKQDKIKMLIDPTNPYTMNAGSAFGRSIDSALISAMRGNAYSGKNGQTSVALPLSQKLLAFTDGVPATPTKLNVDTLVRIKGKFMDNDVDEEEELHIALPSRQLQALLREAEVTGADYAAVKALVRGEIDTFMGFKFHRTQLTAIEDAYHDGAGAIVAAPGTTLSNADHVLAWAGSGVVLAIGQDFMADVSVRNDKSNATQVYACMSVGATRLEEEKVVDVACAIV